MSINISKKLHNKLQSQSGELTSAYSIVYKDDGSFIATKNGRAIHSKYNVEKECENSLRALKNTAKNVIIFSGFGLGAIVKYLCENKAIYLEGKKDLKIIVIINDIELFNYVYHKTDTNYLTNLNIFFFDSSDSYESILSILDINKVRGVELISLPSLTKEEKESTREFYSFFCKSIEVAFSDILTKMHFETIWTKNILLNSPILAESKDISNFKLIFNNQKAILVCAGPTLQNSLEYIKTNKNDLIIIAIDTAYSILAKNNIVPHFILSADAGIFNAYDFIYEQSEFPYLVMDLILNEKVIDIIPKTTRIITFSSTDSLDIIKTLKELENIKIDSLFMSNTIATAMIDFASYLGLTEVLLVGFDNSYPFYYRHVKHALSYEYHINETNKLNTIESYYFNSIKQRSNIENYPPVDFVFENQLKYFSTLNERYEDMKIKRITDEAIKIDSIEEGNINSFLDKNIYKNAMDLIDKYYDKNNNQDKNIKISIKNLYSDMSDNLDLLKKDATDIYNNLITKKENDEIIADYNIKTHKLIEEYTKKIPILSNILSSPIILSQRTKASTFEKTVFILSEIIKNSNYFCTRIKNIADKF